MNNYNVSSTYIMEPFNENERLDKKVDQAEYVQKYLNHFMSPTDKILDVGRMSAVIDEYIALSNPNIHITGIDISANRLIETYYQRKRLPNLIFVSANVYDLPFVDNSFDMVFSRFVFQYIKYPLKALSEIKRVCRPKGYIVIQDIDGQLFLHYPKDEVLLLLDKIFIDINKYIKLDPFIGRKLFHLLYQTEFQKIQVKLEPYHLIAGKAKETDYKYWKEKFQIIQTYLSSYTQFNSAEMNKTASSYLDYLQKEDTISFSNLFTVYGQKK